MRVKMFFIFNNKLPKICLQLICKYNHGGCNATYLRVLLNSKFAFNHLSISHHTDKKVKIDNKKKLTVT